MDPPLPSEPLDSRNNGLPLVAPDEVEDQYAELIDNTVPTRGYTAQPVVALGGSAGSIPALRAFLESVPPASGLAYVVVLHLSPDHESLMAALLQRHTSMPVHTAESHQKIEANSVYVIPPGKHLTATDGHLKLTNLQSEQGKRVAVDLFFRSLADTHGPHATAVVLSGADGDGAIGLKRVKERGGLTIAQVPEEAEHPGMPRSAIATGMVDWILPVTEMPARIIAYHARAANLRLPPEEGQQPAQSVPAPLDQAENELREVLTFLRASTGRDFSCYKRATIIRRIARRMQVNGVDDLAAYLNHLRTYHGEAVALLHDLLISVTNFFRDRECFEVLEGYIPELFRDKKTGDSVRVWVPACATGEEAYSMAMLLQERARQVDVSPKLQVFACDLDEEAIQKARVGFYPDTIAADVSEERLRRFFIKEVGGYRVRHELREMVLFASHDLLRDAPFSRMDLVSCRNLLIYLNREAQARAMDIFHFALRPSGLLFLGSSESADEGGPLFAAVDKKYRLYRHSPVQRVGVPVPAGGGSIHRLLQQHNHLNPRSPILPSRAFMEPNGSVAEPVAAATAGAGELHLKLLSRFGPGSLVVDATYEIVHLSENANRFLLLPEGEPTRNVLRLVHPLLRIDLRAALLRAAENDVPVKIAGRVIDLAGGPEVVQMHVIPGGTLAPGVLLIIFEARDPDDLEKVMAAPAALEPEAVVQQLERELTRANLNLRSTVEQFETGAEELKASNEELQAMNEELRSAGEELETSREEIQSVNEELTTVNGELRSRLEELSRVNSDLRNLMSATAIATVFLGRDLEITRFTPLAAPLFNLIPGDVGRPIGDLKIKLDYPELIADAQKVLSTLVPIEREMRNEKQWFLARILPYRTVDDHIAGVVLTLVDITQRRHAEDALRGSEQKFRTLANASPGLIWQNDAQGNNIYINQHFQDFVGLTAQEINRGGWHSLVHPDERDSYLADYMDAVHGQRAWHRENRIRRHDGVWRWFDNYAQPLLGADGDYLGQVGVSVDITERRIAEAALRESEERQKFLLKVSDGIGSLENIGDVEYVSMRMLGEKLQAGRAFYFQAERDEDGRWGHRINVEYRSDPSLTSLVGRYATRDAVAGTFEGAEKGRVVAVTDVTKITSLTADEIQRYRTLNAVSFIKVPLVRSGKLVAGIGVHHSVPHAWGREEIALIRDVAARSWSAIERLRTEETLRKSKEEQTVLAQESERARAEAEAARAQAEAAGQAKNNFLAVLSHELRTPLTPVAMAAQSLSRRKDLPDAVRDALEMIRRNVMLEARLVDDLLDVTKIERGKMELNHESVDVHEVIRHALEIAASDREAKQQRLTTALAATQPQLEGDGGRLQQVVWNLLKNAVKFTPDGGEIGVRTWNESDKLYIEIRDSGMGIEASSLAHIFDAFNQAGLSVTRRFGGLGLGLAIARAIVTAHNGELLVASEGAGRGAVFTIVLPVSQPKSDEVT